MMEEYATRTAAPGLTTSPTAEVPIRNLMVLVFIIGLLLAPLGWRQVVRWYYGRQIEQPETAAPQRVAIVFGAAVYADGRLSSVLRDRVDTAIALYHAGKVQKLLLSGDNQFDHYNEPGAMMAYAQQRGVPAADLQPDYGGWRTYDTCYRAKRIFGLSEAVLITQDFHLPRALFTCRRLGVAAIGVSADQRPYRAARWYELRETAATLYALWDIVRQAPPPVMGAPIPLS